MAKLSKEYKRTARTARAGSGPFFANDLQPDRTYDLQLSDEEGALGQSWPLKTLPDRNADPEWFKLMTFTCAGGSDGLGIPSR